MTSSPERLRLIKLIHVARRDLERAGKMDEPTYRTMLMTAGNADSTSKMGVPALMKVLEQAKKAGFKVRASKPDRSQDARADARKVRALWLFLHELGEVKNPSEAALAQYVKRISGVDDMHWAGGPAMMKLIETLKKWAMRAALPVGVAALARQVSELAAAQPLTRAEHLACLSARNLVTAEHPTFDGHWRAWEIYSAVLGQAVPAAIAEELGSEP